MAKNSKKVAKIEAPVPVNSKKALKVAKIEAPVPVKPTKGQQVAAPKVAAKVAKAVAKAAKVPAQVAGATASPIVGQAKFADTARITLVRKDNPRKEVAGKGGSDYDTPHKRYAVIIQVANSKDNTVAAFLKVLPKWRATLNRAVKEGHIQIATLTAAVLVGGMLYNVPVIS
jgi:hypothetical protein